MGLIASLRSWLSVPDDAAVPDTPPPAAPSPPAVPAPPTDPPPPDTGSVVASRQERLASRLLDDERLRGDLTDDAFQPILDWALTLSDHIAASTGHLDDAAADPVLDKEMAALKTLVGSAVQAVGAQASGDGSTRDTALRNLSRLASRSPLSRLLRGSARGNRNGRSPLAASSIPDGMDAVELAKQIAAVLSPAAEAPTASPAEPS